MPAPFKPTYRSLGGGRTEYSGTHPIFGKRGTKSSITGTNMLHDLLLQDYGIRPESVESSGTGDFRLVGRESDMDAISAALAQITSDPVLNEGIQPGFGEVVPGGGGAVPGPGGTPIGPIGSTGDPTGRGMRGGAGVLRNPGDVDAAEGSLPPWLDQRFVGGGIAPGYLERGPRAGGNLVPGASDYLGHFLFNRGTDTGIPGGYGRGRNSTLNQFLRHLRFYYGDVDPLHRLYRRQEPERASPTPIPPAAPPLAAGAAAPDAGAAYYRPSRIPAPTPPMRMLRGPRPGLSRALR